jgi:hypothetical protein
VPRTFKLSPIFPRWLAGRLDARPIERTNLKQVKVPCSDDSLEQGGRSSAPCRTRPACRRASQTHALAVAPRGSRVRGHARRKLYNLWPANWPRPELGILRNRLTRKRGGSGQCSEDPDENFVPSCDAMDHKHPITLECAWETEEKAALSTSVAN